MLVLLPPSETKWAGPRRGTRVRPETLSRPELTGAREHVLAALIAASSRPDALELLHVGPGLADTVAANLTLRTRPAAPAGQVYTGVLYDALDLPSLPATAARRVLIVSALWGALTPRDRVSGYRLSMNTDLPGVGPLARFWRPHLSRAIQPAGVVVDCRSAAYAAAWAPDPETAARTVAVRVLSGGTVVSHAAKHTRGLLARHLLTRPGRAPTTVARLAAAAAEQFAVDLHPPGRLGTGWTLEVEAPGGDVT